jgi:O-antigen/teichoic acid export membrane protein
MIARIRNSDFVRHGALVFLAIIAANLFTYLYYALVGRIVGVDGYGVVSALFSATLLVVTPPSTVAATIVARMAAELRATGDDAKLRRLGVVVTAVSVITGIAAFVVVALFAGGLARFFHLDGSGPVLAAGSLLACSLALPAQRGVFQGAQSFRLFAISNIVEAVVKCALGVLCAIRFGATGALIGLALGSLAATLYNGIAMLTSYGRRSVRLKLDVRRMIASSSGIGLAVLAINALLFYDVIIVRHFFPAVTAGLYGAAILAGRALYTVVLFVPTVVLPKTSARSSAGERTDRLLFAALGTAAAIIGVALAVTAVVPGTIVTLLAGKQYAGAAPFVFPYAAALGMLALANIVAMYNIGRHNFAFVAPLGIVAIAEIGIVCSWHTSILQVLSVLFFGHLAALGATLIRVKHGPAHGRQIA